MKRYRLIFSWMCLMALLVVGCSDDKEWSENYDIKWPVTTITSVSPMSAGPGDVLTISSENMQHTYMFYIGTYECDILSRTPTQITVEVPAQLTERSLVSVLNVYNRRFEFTEGLFTPILP